MTHLKYNKPTQNYTFPLMRILIAVCFLLQISFSYSQNDFSYKIVPIASEKIAINGQLSQGRVSDIVEDERGLIWIGTLDGLNRYDGYKVKVFRHQMGDSTSLDNNQIIRVLKTTKGYLWVLTKTGINKFDLYRETSCLLTFPQENHSVSKINDIILDKVENLWIARSDGLYVLKQGSKVVEKIELQAYFNSVHTLEVDHFNNIWIGCDKDYILKYNHQLKEIYTYDFPREAKYDKGFLIYDIHQDQEQNIWLAFHNDAIFKQGLPNVLVLDKGNDHFRLFTEYLPLLAKNNEQTFMSTIRKFGSRDKELWISGMSNGLGKINHRKKEFTYYPEYRDFLWQREIDKNVIYFDSNDELWIGTNGNGVFILPRREGLFNVVNKELYDAFALMSVRSFLEYKEKIFIGGYSGMVSMDKKTKEMKKIDIDNVVYCMEHFPGNSNYILLGTEGNGLVKLDPKTGSYELILREIGNDSGLEKPWMWIFDIYNDGDSVYWYGAKNGVIKHRLKTDSYRVYNDDENNDFKFGNILNIYRDFSGRLLIGSNEYGLLEFDYELDKFKKFRCWRNKDFDFQSFRINHINQTLDSTYWISTDKGLIKLCENNIRIITKNDGLLNDYVYASIADGQGNLWLSTNDGVYRYHQKENRFNSFTVFDGLQGQEFNTAAHYKSKDGTIYFGGVKGFNYFNPENIFHQKKELPIEIIGLYYDNEEVKIEKKAFEKRNFAIHKDIEYVKIEFAALLYHANLKCRYKYRIESHQSGFIDLGFKNEISFHNLKPGDYKIEIFAADHHGNWNQKPFIINLNVDAYFYEKQLFKYGSIFLVVFLVFIVFNYRYVLMKQQKFEIERLVKERTTELSIVNDELKKANETKDKFFAIISHDIKNPLASAQSVSTDLLENGQEYTSKEKNVLLGIINRSMQHLQVLLENLRSWSMLQNKEIKPQFEKCDVKKIIQNNTSLVAASLIKKRLELIVHVEEKAFIKADCKMIDAILRNVISNAIKFSYFDSIINISAKKKGDLVEIQVEDNGVGMTEKQVEDLFIPGLTQSLKGTDNERGTGFGLLMVYEFMQLNKGMIDVISAPNHGSRFILSFQAFTEA